MTAYGFDFKDKKARPDTITLKELCLDCTREELDDLIEFIRLIRNDMKPDCDDHRHFRDYSDLWSEGQTDLIICLSENQQKTT